MEFFTKYNPAPSEGFKTEGRSLTQQSFKDECDINKLIKRLVDPNETVDLRDLSKNAPRMPLWGDFSAVPDVHTAHDIFLQAEAAFMTLPAAVRARFNNSPVELLAFTENPANREEVKKLFGAPAAVAPEVIPKVDGVASVNSQVISEQ